MTSSTREMRGQEVGRSPLRGSGQWRDVVGYEGLYRVSASGEVYSSRSRRLMRPFIVKGYPSISLKVGGRRVAGRVHRMVAEAFHGASPADKPECAHLDGNPQNNSADNLAWVSRSENESHKKLHLRHRRGERAQGAKLTNEQAEIIRNAAYRRMTRQELARLLGVSVDTIYDILNGNSYNG